MNSEEQIRKYFLVGAGILLVIIVAGLVWAIMADSGEGGDNLDPNITFNDNQNPAIGPSDAKVTVRIYSDFQCPACQFAEAELAQIRNEYQDRVRFIWNDLPLTQIHPNATAAAAAARCAGEQGHFWEYADRIFATQDAWEYMQTPRTHFLSLSQEYGMDEESFTKCMVNGQNMGLIKADYQEAVSMNLTGTPTFFINRKMIVGAIDAATWRTELDSALAN
jgi:protein-disulfide isomerase